MTTQEQDTLILEAFDQAPPAVRMFFISGRFDAFTEELGMVTTLQRGVQTKVANEILMVLLGITEATALITNLKTLGATDEQVSAIIALADEEVFKPIAGAPTTTSKTLTLTPETNSAPQPQLRTMSSDVRATPVASKPPVTPLVAQSPDAKELKETLKQYGVDPYREPTE